MCPAEVDYEQLHDTKIQLLIEWAPFQGHTTSNRPKTCQGNPNVICVLLLLMFSGWCWPHDVTKGWYVAASLTASHVYIQILLRGVHHPCSGSNITACIPPKNNSCTVCLCSAPPPQLNHAEPGSRRNIIVCTTLMSTYLSSTWQLLLKFQAQEAAPDTASADLLFLNHCQAQIWNSYS